MHDGPIPPSGGDPLPPVPTLPEPVAPLPPPRPSGGRFALWQLAMLLAWGGIFHARWHSPWLPALIGAFVLFEAFAVWDFRRQRRRWRAPRPPATTTGTTGSRL